MVGEALGTTQGEARRAYDREEPWPVKYQQHIGDRLCLLEPEGKQHRSIGVALA